MPTDERRRFAHRHDAGPEFTTIGQERLPPPGAEQRRTRVGRRLTPAHRRTAREPCVSEAVPALPVSEAGSVPDRPALTGDDVRHLARLARLELTDTELETFRGQLAVILESVATVSEVAGGQIVPTTHAVPLTNVFRADVAVAGLSRVAALAGAPEVEDDRFRVPQILGDEQ